MGGAPPDFQRLFEASPEVLLVLLPDSPRFTMVAATAARFEATHTTRDSLGRGLFELFPDNADDAAATARSRELAATNGALREAQLFADLAGAHQIGARG